MVGRNDAGRDQIVAMIIKPHAIVNKNNHFTILFCKTVDETNVVARREANERHMDQLIHVRRGRLSNNGHGKIHSHCFEPRGCRGGDAATTRHVDVGGDERHRARPVVVGKLRDF